MVSSINSLANITATTNYGGTDYSSQIAALEQVLTGYKTQLAQLQQASSSDDQNDSSREQTVLQAKISSLETRIAVLKARQYNAQNQVSINTANSASAIANSSAPSGSNGPLGRVVNVYV